MRRYIFSVDDDDPYWIKTFNAWAGMHIAIGQEIAPDDVRRIESLASKFNREIVCDKAVFLQEVGE